MTCKPRAAFLSETIAVMDSKRYFEAFVLRVWRAKGPFKKQRLLQEMGFLQASMLSHAQNLSFQDVQLVQCLRLKSSRQKGGQKSDV